MKTEMGKMNISKSGVKIVASHIIGIIILLYFANLLISYSQGNFEFPFIDRTNQGGGTVVIPDHRPRDSGSDYLEDEPTEAPSDIINIINPELLVAATNPAGPGSSGSSQAVGNTEAAEPAFEFFSDDLKNQGFALSDGVYEPYDEIKVNAAKKNYKTEVEKILSEAEDPELAVIPEPPVLYEYKIVRIEPEFSIPKAQKISLYSGPKDTVEAIMDFILIRSGENEILCTASGKVITFEYDASELIILKMRDDFGNTVFKQNDLYYIYDESLGEFVQITFSEILGDRGVPFMYPSGYGANGANGLDRDYNSYNRKWGYKVSGTGLQRFGNLGRIYSKAFNFNEDIGIAYQDAAGSGYKLFFFNDSGQYIFYSNNYFAPDEVTTKHLGFFYFDHGLTRVIYRNLVGMAYIDKEMVIDTAGNQFYIPEDYEVKAYSNGMFLLAKNGFYGYMNYLGEWVGNPIYTYAQPFYEGVAVIGLANGKKALIDTQGNLLLKFNHEAILNCTGGIVAYYQKGVGWTVLNKVRRQVEIG
jgi:hypothetical protein